MPNAINIRFGKYVRADVLSKYSKDVLSDIMEKAQLSDCLVTSTQRSPSDQARAMYDNLVFQGVKSQKQLYGPNGDKVIDVYVELKNKGKSASEIKEAMTLKILQLGPDKVSKHCADPKVLNVFDVAPSSIKDKNAFEKAVENDNRVSKFLKPPADPAYHIEIKQIQITLLSLASVSTNGNEKLLLTDSQTNKIIKHKPVFESVEERTGVPWEAVSAVWTRESFSVAPPVRPGGQFQFDPVPSNNILKTMLRRFSNLSEYEILETVGKGVTVFEAAALFCACFMRMKIKPTITPDASDEVIKEAFWAYNGRAYGGADNSPYVMNGYDANHMNMIIRGTLPNPNGGARIKVETVDKRPGAYTVYSQLKSIQ